MLTRMAQEVLEEANGLKTRGNDLFRESSWQRALEVYLEGLNALPPRSPLLKDTKGKRKADDEWADNDTEEPASKSTIPQTATEPSTLSDASPLALAEQQCTVLRSILNSNIAACHSKLVSLSPWWLIPRFHTIPANY